MAKIGQQFVVKGDFFGKLKVAFDMYNKMILQKDLKKKLTAATDIAYRLARTPRAMIMNKAGRRVSDPHASYGVPVQTGVLQSSIKKGKIKIDEEKASSSIYVDNKVAPYSMFIEYGTSKMRARPFMRPVANMMKQITKNLFRKPVEHR